MDGSHTSDAFEINLKVQWRRAGRITLNRDGSLKFPDVPFREDPGVYRVIWKKRGEKKHIYIGEARDPWSRTTSYRRRPAKARAAEPQMVVPRIPPNRDLSVKLRQAIRSGRGGFAEYQIAHVISLTLGDSDVEPILDMVQRKLIENAALVDAHRRRATIFNADAHKK